MSTWQADCTFYRLKVTWVHVINLYLLTFNYMWIKSETYVEQKGSNTMVKNADVGQVRQVTIWTANLKVKANLLGYFWKISIKLMMEQNLVQSYQKLDSHVF